MKQLISQGLFLLSEIGVIVVMLIIIARERKKRKATHRQNRRPMQNSALQKSKTLYLD